MSGVFVSPGRLVVVFVGVFFLVIVGGIVAGIVVTLWRMGVVGFSSRWGESQVGGVWVWCRPTDCIFLWVGACFGGPVVF